MAEFRRPPKAITKAGQVKGSGGRHEKDDRFRIDDRSRYVLGWSNQRKLDALLDKARALSVRLSEVGAEKERCQKAHAAAIKRGEVLAGLDQTHEFAEIDWQSVVNRAEQLKAEQRELEAASAELARLKRELDTVKEQISDADGGLGELNGRLGGLDTRQYTAEGTLREAREILGEDACEPARAQFAAIGELLARAGQPAPPTAAACDRAETDAGTEIARAGREAGRPAVPVVATEIVVAMGEFRRQYPAEDAELDASVEAADGYRELHDRLTGDDLPRFRQQFKMYLNQNTIRMSPASSPS